MSSIPPPQLELSHCTREDIPALIPIYFSAFKNDSIRQKVFPQTPVVEKWWIDLLLHEFDTQNGVHFLKVLLDGQIVAFAKWVNFRPKEAPAPDPLDLPQWPDDPGSDHSIADAFFSALGNAHDKVVGGKQHWYLEIIGTRSQAQGLGAARMMIKWGIEQAESQPVDNPDEMEGRTIGVPCFLEASPKGRRVFEKEGFHQVGEAFEMQFGQETFVETFMIREPSG